MANRFFGIFHFPFRPKESLLIKLSSTVIQDLQEICRLDPSNLVAWWYFQFDKGYTKSVDALARSWIRQLSRSPLLPSVTDLWNEHGRRGSRPSPKAILAVLDDVLSRTEGQIYLVLDALDECPQLPGCRERESLLSLMLSIVKRHSGKVHIIATSRPEDDITEELGKSSMLDLEARLVEDVKEFVTAAISRYPLKRYSEKGKKLIFDTLLSSRERYVNSVSRYLFSSLVNVCEANRPHKALPVGRAANQGT